MDGDGHPAPKKVPPDLPAERCFGGGRDGAAKHQSARGVVFGGIDYDG